MTEGICDHCHCEIKLRNPSGYCDHLHYPENCKVCNKDETHAENFLAIIMSELDNSGQIITHPDKKGMVLHEGKQFRITVEEVPR